MVRYTAGLAAPVARTSLSAGDHRRRLSAVSLLLLPRRPVLLRLDWRPDLLRLGMRRAIMMLDMMPDLLMLTIYGVGPETVPEVRPEV